MSKELTALQAALATIERYEMDYGLCPCVLAEPDGEWVRFDDVKRLLATVGSDRAAVGMSDATAGLSSTVPENYENPAWEDAGRVHDWLNYASNDIRAIWPELPMRHRAIIAASLQETADSEEWD